ncbi:hypothetical protein BKA70DRAFT_1220668 [Coprinopsis sp. MPI-PUGE-AT-0042]|nr:hypothetical protein BKA70DRAFT_1220668 [Coprinopsis sp. MPI-PUGE-AT-0042]
MFSANLGAHEALTLSLAQHVLANLDAESVAEAYKQFESASDKNFEDNMRILTQNVMEIDNYMSHVWQILLSANDEIFHGDSPFLDQWRALHERFRGMLQQSRDLALRLAEKIRVFYDVLLPLLQAELAVPVQQKIEAFERFANPGVFLQAEDEAGVDRSMQEDQEAAQKLARDFDDLCVDIASFAASFEVSIKGTDENFAKKIRELKEIMRRTDEDFHQSQDIWHSISAVFGGPRSSQDILNELRAIDRDLGETTRTYDNVEHLIQVGLPIIHEEVDRIGDKMKLRAQTQEAQLNLRQSMDGEMPNFMRPDTIKQMKFGYLKLYICVEQYASGLEPIFERDF